MELYEHNRVAYERVMQAFETNNKAAIVHSTGTGKSIIAAEVAKHFGKVLVLAPNNFVLNETRKWCGDNCIFRTYASNMYEQLCGFDLVVFDEFHRAGAPQWGKGVQQLIELNKGAKFLGLSATSIRYLDGERNMADELFDGNVVSELLLPEAIRRGILPNPTYVCSIYDIDTDYNKLSAKIRSKRGSDKDKEIDLAKLARTTSAWKAAYGVPSIIRKYFRSDMKRVIVFTSKVGHFDETREMLSNWFVGAGYSHLDFYRINYTEPNVENEMARFQDDSQFERETNPVDLKIAISVDMLNEGVHVPRVDGVIMLRGTISRIIIEQQVGRCLTADNNGRTPVVLDLVNNMDSIRYGAVDMSSGVNSKDADSKLDYEFPFKVIDECRDIRVFYNQLNQLYSVQRVEGSFHDRLLQVLDYCKTYNCAPPKSAKGEWHDISCTYAWARARYRKGVLSEEDCSVMEEILAITDRPLVGRLDAVVEYVKKYNKVPSSRDNSEVARAYHFLTKKKSEGKWTDEEKAKYDEIQSLLRDAIWEDDIKPRLEKFYNEHGRLPLPQEDRYATKFLNNHTAWKKDKYAHRLQWLDEHGYSTYYKRKNGYEENYEEMKSFFEQNDYRLPMLKDNKRMVNLYHGYNKYLRGARTIPKGMSNEFVEKLRELLSKVILPFDINDRLDRLEEKYKDGRKIPAHSADRDWLNDKVRRVAELTDEQYKRVVALVGHDVTNIHRTPNLELVEWIKANHRLPTPKDDKRMYNKMMKFRKRVNGVYTSREKDPETYEFLLQNGFSGEVNHRD